jgi:hypothetical protein
LRGVLAGDATVDEALAAYGAFSARHRSAFRITYALQRVIPLLPPRALTMVIRALSRQRLADAIFNWYLGLLPLRLVEEPTLESGGPRFSASRGRGRPRVA